MGTLGDAILKTLQRMSVTDAAAWWGAVIATIVLAWDIYKWMKTGPIVNVSIRPNMRSNPRELPFILVEVTNTGDRATTLTNLVGIYYRSISQRFRKQGDYTFVVLRSSIDKPLPCILEPGQRWLGGIRQSEQEGQMIKDGYLYCGVQHSSAKKPVLRRVVSPKNPSR